MALPWFRLYPKIIDHRRWLSLTRVQRSCYIEILCAAAMEEPPGIVPLLGLGARLRWKPKQFSEALAAVIEVGLLEPVHVEDGSCSCRGRVVFAPCSCRVHAWDALQYESDHAKLRQAKLRESRKTPPKSDGQAPSLSRPRDGTDTDSDSDSDSDTDQRASLSQASENETTTGETPDPPDQDDEKETLRLEAEDTRVRKANPLYEAAMRVVVLHAGVFGLPGKPPQNAVKTILGCLGRNCGMTEWDCRLAVYARWGDSYSVEQGWTTLLHIFGNRERARQLASEGESAREAWFKRQARMLLERKGGAILGEALDEQARMLMDMEAEQFGGNGRPRDIESMRRDIEAARQEATG